MRIALEYDRIGSAVFPYEANSLLLLLYLQAGVLSSDQGDYDPRHPLVSKEINAPPDSTSAIQMLR